MHLPSDPKARKDIPITTGVLDYFPRAIAAVAEVSKIGNDQHNPGQPLHWARGKSTDHADCISRHLIDRGTRDADGARHSAKLAWRALALLEEELEREAGIDPHAEKPNPNKFFKVWGGTPPGGLSWSDCPNGRYSEPKPEGK